MKLIVNADDYGLTKGVSRGILYGMKHGIITDTSAIVNTSAFEECAKMALDAGINSMGIHLLLTMGLPLSSKDQIPSLLKENGCFCQRNELVNMKFDRSEVRLELNAQIKRFLDTGLKLNHIDTHHGFMNLSKDMADIFEELSHTYQVPLRNEASFLTPDKRMFASTTNVFLSEDVYFNHGAAHHTVEDVQSYLKSALLQFKCVEIGCHPGYSDDELRKISVLNDDREIDLTVFCDKQLQIFIMENAITLTKAG